MASGRAAFSGRRRWASVVLGGGLAGCLILGGTAGPVASAMPEVTLTLSISPTHVGDTGVFTVRGTVTTNVPISGVKLVMMQTAGVAVAFVGCAPSCWQDVAHVFFELPSVGTSATVSAQYQVSTGNVPPVGFTFGLTAPEVMVNIPPTVWGYGPTLKMSIARAAGTVMPGSAVHFVATATTSVGPVHGVLIQVVLPQGFEPPTNFSSATALWAGDPYRTIEWVTDVDSSSALQFDSTVTAALGTNLKVSGLLHPAYSWAAAPNGASLTVHVGPAATATPKPTPRPTARPTPRATLPPARTATARATPRPASSSAASPVPSPGVTTAPSPSEAEGGPPTAPAIANPAAAPSAGLATTNSAIPAPSSATTPVQSTGPAGALGAAGFAVALVAGAGLFIRRRREGWRR